MSSAIRKPTSIIGIKKLAREIKKDTGHSQFDCLNSAAKAAGFQTYNHAFNTLNIPSPQTSLFQYQVTFTVKWEKFERGIFRSGEKSATVRLPAPFPDLFGLKDRRGYLRGFRKVTRDHYQYHEPQSEDYVAELLAYRAARTVRFSVATGLMPIQWKAEAFPRTDSTLSGEESIIPIPRKDHVACWIDKAGCFVISDEPYADNPLPEFTSARQEWCKEHGYRSALPAWKGIHNPGYGTRIYLFSRDVDLDPIVTALNQLPQIGTGMDVELLEPEYRKSH
ncbi:hypothetical protein [Pseudomonas asgharzadehiana]|uniref:Uncharacterized protein n=1 Tax=Pseudomonas asgharzadehiana TaxID=2842349 RepID=A0ABX8NX42_9PSED|nr:hypothetical protein [Pseudomonas asgharzadehiana]QXH65831.1 hypothetical protein KSS96_19760 [Pseudomonas asgharzadehiana]